MGYPFQEPVKEPVRYRVFYGDDQAAFSDDSFRLKINCLIRYGMHCVMFWDRELSEHDLTCIVCCGRYEGPSHSFNDLEPDTALPVIISLFTDTVLFAPVSYRLSFRT